MRLVLVHGAFQDKRVWDDLVQKLLQNGCQVDVVNLPGREDSPGNPKAVRLEHYVQAIVSTLRQQDREATLVCHSFAGIHGTVAASRCIEKVEGIVFLAANIAANGETAYSLLEDYPAFQEELRTATQSSGRLTKQNKRADVLAKACSAEAKAKFLSIFQEEPASPYFDYVYYEADWASFLNGRIRYYLGSDDKAIDKPHAAFYASRAGTTPIEIDGGDHELMLSRPDILVRELLAGT